MKILNPNLASDIDSGTPINLDLGCGQNPRSGFYSVDHIEMEGVDVIADLNQPLTMCPDDSVENIYSRHVFEHVREFLPLMREIHRIIKPGGSIEIVVPHFSNVFGFSDPTHLRFFGLFTMYYFVAREHQPQKRKVPDFYADTRFQIRSITIEFYRTTLFDKLVHILVSKMVNFNMATQTFYERRLSSLLHAWQIRYLLEPDK